MSDFSEYESDDQQGILDRITHKMKTSPFLIAGVLGLATVCGIGAYKFKTKGSMPTSLYLVQLRVTAQGTALACITLGVAYHMYKQHFGKEDKIKAD